MDFANFLLINFVNKDFIYISICIPVYDMEKYIERALLSILNQSFQKYEIIIVNDNSKDNTGKIIKNYSNKFNQIQIINHNTNFGVYYSRIEAILNSKGKYILLIDPDDMILNPKLFQELFNYNIYYNLDIIEFTVYLQIEEKKKIVFSKNHKLSHYHYFQNKIIYQPELSDILFYIPNTKNYSSIICRPIWNKIIKKEIFLKTIKYTEKEFHNKYLIAADDTPLNILNFQYASNYSNINLPGYLYNIRTNSISRKENNETNYKLIISYNYLLYFKLFYKYIKDYNKDINYLLYDLRANFDYILRFNNCDILEYKHIIINLFNNLLSKENITNEFQDLFKGLLLNCIK